MVGQRHVVRTLSNAIERDQVHHAYLFVGSRGTGKTSMAKILAASLNCENGGPTLTPCGVCESCRSIAAGTSVNVIEMDAASNRSVNDIRGLRDRVAFAPTAGSWKVYILDEAHMLTKEAWNAFLKTLEEPPPNTVFILATTEAHKVMPTISDRCQRFDFQRPSMEQLSEVLNRVAAAESIEIDQPAVSMISRSASGSFRDALGTLDQLVAYSGKSIALDDVLELLGAADADLLFGVVDAVVASDPKAVLAQVETMAQSGRDPARFARDMLGHLRVLLVTRTTGEIPEALAVTASDAPRLAAQAGAIGPASLIRTIDELAAALTTIREGDEARLAVEVALLKAARPDLDPGAEGLMRRIEKLEHAAGSPRPAPAPAQPEPPVAADPGPGEQHETLVEAPGPVEDTEEPVSTEPVTAAEPDPEPPAPAGDLGLEKLNQLWPTVIEALRASGSGPTASYFEGTRPIGAGGGEVEIGFPPEASFNRRNAEKPERRDQLAQALLTVTGERLEVAFGDLDGEDPAGEAFSSASEKVGEDEFVEKLKSEFNAEEVI